MLLDPTTILQAPLLVCFKKVVKEDWVKNSNSCKCDKF